MLTRTLVLGALAFALALTPLQAQESPTVNEATAPATTAPGAAGATLKGTIKWEGKAPKNKLIKMTSDPVCVKLHEDAEVREDTYTISDDGAFKDVVVFIAEGLPDQDWPVRTDPIVLNQEGCHYTPHVFGIQIGQPLKIQNSDPTTHNVHFKSKYNGDWNMTQSEKGTVDPKDAFKRPESDTALFKCDIHTWMEARVAIFKHPFFSVSGADGTFEITGLPAGKYRVWAWHEKAGEQASWVDVAADGTATADFTFSRKKSKVE